MDSSQSILTVRRPDTALSSVTELVGSGQINPSPVTVVDRSILSQLILSPEKLKSLTGTQDLDQVTTLEMCVDIQENTLGNFGVYMPKLVQLRMNNSLNLSVRDLGTSLSHIRVLSLIHCGLADLEGISSLPSLKELYVAYNNVSDLCQVGMLEHLELLDLERNNVDDLAQVHFLGLCEQLRTLCLKGNPICMCPNPENLEDMHVGLPALNVDLHNIYSCVDVPKHLLEVSDYNYRTAVRKLIPQLHCLDGAPVEEVEPRCSSTPMEDWTLVKESIKDIASITDSACGSLEVSKVDERAASVCGLSRPCSAQRSGTSLSFSGLSSHPAPTRPLSSSSDSRPSSAGSDPDTLLHETCDLTHGVGRILFCGNPVQAIRARRQKIKHQVTKNHSRPCTQLGTYVPEHTYDVEETSSQDRSDVFAELRAWAKGHSKQLLAVEKNHQPQIMRIVHNDNNDTEDDDDCSHEYDETIHNLNINNNGEQELMRGGQNADHRYIDPLDCSFQSPSPDLPETGAVSPEVSRLSYLSDHTQSPSPPSRDLATSRSRRITEIRARRLRASNSGAQKPTGEILLPNKILIRKDTNPMSMSAETMKIQPAPPQLLHKPHRPDSNPVNPPPREPCSETPGGSVLSINEHGEIFCSNTPQRPTPTRPHTARATLQRPDGHRILLPGRGSPHPD